ncbi:MAG: hypothetical protein AAFX06_29280 [Planctomycetota bacterium]
MQDLDLPMPLRRFYEFAGRWTARLPSAETGLEYFYTGAGYHHLLPLESGNPVKQTHDGFIEFYTEYQGEWEILTKPGNRSDGIWLRGCWQGCPQELEHELYPTTRLPISLVDFLISHILFTSFIEFPNNLIPSGVSLENAIREELGPSSLIWEAPKTEFPICFGKFYQLPNCVFAWECEGKLRFGTNHPHAVRMILETLAD